eukprot:SAG22_NODE_4235_length_1332_cov_2.052717_1_plen_379_part_10
MELLLLLLLLLALLLAAGAGADEECCWCGKKYRVDRGLGADTGGHWAQNRTLAGPDLVDVQPDKSFYVAGLDEQPSLFFYVRHIHVLGRQLAVTITVPEAGDQEKLVWEEELTAYDRHDDENPTDHGINHRVRLPLPLVAGKLTKVRWNLHHWPLLRHRGPGESIAKGTVRVIVAQDVAKLEHIHASRVVRQDHGRMHTQTFGPRTGQVGGAAAAGLIDYPFGFFANWGGWLAADIKRLDELAEVGQRHHPVSPFEDAELLDRFLARSAELELTWDFDMRHITADVDAIVPRVKRWAGSGAVGSWYISDEPDGAGDEEGAPVGRLRPAQLRKAYQAVKKADPFHVVVISLNCLHSAPFYASYTDILLVDPYPIGIDTNG